MATHIPHGGLAFLSGRCFFLLTVTLILVACSGGGGSLDNRDRARDAAAVAEQARLQAEAEAEVRRLEAEKAARKKAEQEAADADFAKFLAEQQRQMAAAEALRKQEEERRRVEAERQQRLTAEREMGIWAEATVAVTAGDDSLPLPPFRNKEVYIAWGPAPPIAGTPIPQRGEFLRWGPWSQNISADMGAMSFGVRIDPAYGVYRPWISGPDIHGDTGNLRMGGMKWEGPLVGFTPTGEPVTGKATLSHFQSFWSGHPSFDLNLTGLAYHNTGETWGDGDLFYLVGKGWGANIGRSNAEILNKTFSYPYASQRYRHPVDPKLDVFPWTGIAEHDGPPTPVDAWKEQGSTDYRGRDCCIGDEGMVRGMFFGPKWEGMAGTLHRDDLIAAFGGRR